MVLHNLPLGKAYMANALYLYYRSVYESYIAIVNKKYIR